MSMITIITDMAKTKNATAWLVFSYMKALSQDGKVRLSNRDICEYLNLTYKTAANCLIILQQKNLITPVKGIPFTYRLLLE